MNWKYTTQNLGLVNSHYFEMIAQYNPTLANTFNLDSLLTNSENVFIQLFNFVGLQPILILLYNPSFPCHPHVPTWFMLVVHDESVKPFPTKRICMVIQ